MHIIEIFYEIHHKKIPNIVIANKKENRPMKGVGLKESLVYYATISCNDNNYKLKLYKESCKASLVTTKKHLTYHCTNMTPRYQYWNLQMQELNPQISWKTKGIYKSYIPTSKHCNLCLTEKLEILDNPDKNLLSKRSEIISQCRIDLKH